MKTVTVRRTIIETTRARTGNGTPFLVKEYPKNKRSLVLGLSPAGREAIINLIAVRKLGPGDRLFSMTAERTCVDGKVMSNDPKRSPVWPAGVPIGRSYFRERIWLRAIKAAELPVRRPCQSAGLEHLLDARRWGSGDDRDGASGTHSVHHDAEVRQGHARHGPEGSRRAGCNAGAVPMIW